MTEPTIPTWCSSSSNTTPWITSSLVHLGGGTGMWDEEDGFFYDVLRLPDGQSQRLKVRSMVGLLPLCAATVFEPEVFEKYPEIVPRFQRFIEGRRSWGRLLTTRPRPAVGGRHLFAVLDETSSAACWRRCWMKTSSWPLRHSLPLAVPRQSSLCIPAGGQEYRVAYLPAESDTGMFGGNSNWRGPVWMPVNVLIIRALLLITPTMEMILPSSVPRAPGGT